MHVYQYREHIYSFYTIIHYRLLQGIQDSSLCYTVGPWCLSVLYMCVYFKSQTPNLFLPTPLVIMFVFCVYDTINKLICIIFLNSTYKVQCRCFIHFKALNHTTKLQYRHSSQIKVIKISKE